MTKNILNELLEIKHRLDEARPKNWIDIILSTKYPIGENGLRVEYKGKFYLILHWVTVDKIKSECIVQKIEPPAAIGLSALPLGIPVVENDELVEEILLYHEERINKSLHQTANGTY